MVEVFVVMVVVGETVLAEELGGLPAGEEGWVVAGGVTEVLVVEVVVVVTVVALAEFAAAAGLAPDDG